MKIGEIIMKKREGIGLSRKELAELADVSERTIYNIEGHCAEKQCVNLKTLVKIAKALDLNIQEVMKVVF